MKRAISILLAVATMAFATSAMAATTVGTVTGSKNYTTFVTSNSSTTMPCFNPGNTVTFTLTDTGLSAGDQITLITYKYAVSPTYDNTTVQYINQYTATGTTQDVEYVVRDLAAGIYQLDIKAGDSDVKTVFYKIGTAVAAVIPNADASKRPGNTTAYRVLQTGPSEYSIGFVGKVTIDSADINLLEMGLKPGFEISNGSKTNTYKFETGTNSLKTVSAAQESDGVEIGGSYSFVYGMTVYNVPSANGVTATEAVLR